MRIGYCKLGRSWNLNPQNFSEVGGDVDSYRALKLLAERHPEHDFILIGRNSGEDPQEVGLPANVVQFWTKEVRDDLREKLRGRGSPLKTADMDRTVQALDDLTMDTWKSLDQVVVWAGQHGTSNSRIRMTNGSGAYTNPQDAFVLYGSYIVRGITAWRNDDPVNREEVWLCSDPRNYVKARDLRWPLRHPIISQFNQTREQKFERYTTGEKAHPDFPLKRIEHGHIWVSQSRYTYDRLEMTALPDPSEIPFDLELERMPFGMVINENRKQVTNPRLQVMLQWVMPNWPLCEIFGKWSPDSMVKMKREDIRTVANEDLFKTLSRWRSTLTTPASGSGWATAKPWECFASGTICFFHPKYDTQGHIIPLKPGTGDADLDHLVRWLRPQTPEQLKIAVEQVASDDSVYRWLATAQRKYFERSYEAMTPIIKIEERIGLRA